MSEPSRPSRQQRRPREVDPVAERPHDRWRRIGRRTAWVLAGLAIVALVVRVAIGDPQLEAVELAADAVEQARADAGCEVVATEPAGDGTHLDTGVGLADVDTGAVQPPTGAPHYAGTSLIILEGADNQLDVLSLGHNLEHGAVVAWYDPTIDDATVNGMQEWSGLLNNSGFTNSQAGAAIFVAPFDDPGISSGATIALRAWGLGVDCDRWDPTVANSFVIEAYGNRDSAPEGVPFPDGTISYADPPPTFRQSAGSAG